MRARDVVEAAARDRLSGEDGSIQGLNMFQPASSLELEELRIASEQRPIPPELNDLLKVTSGFEFSPVGIVDFLGREMSVETFFRSVPILADGLGNFWVIDLEGDTDSAGPVIFWCHDPAVAVIQAQTLAQFLEQIFDLGRSPHKNWLKLTKDACRRLWLDDHLIPVEEARQSGDKELAEFASSLPNSFYLADLRRVEVGTGFAWGKSRSDLRRARTDQFIIRLGIIGPGLPRR